MNPAADKRTNTCFSRAQYDGQSRDAPAASGAELKLI